MINNEVKMANDYNTGLVCKSNRQLLQKIDPRDIIKNPNSEFISCKKGVYYFSTCSGTMHESIVALSMTYPNEVFIAKYRDDDIHYDSVIQTFKYKSGKSILTKIKPDYWYCISHIEKTIGKQTIRRFMKVALKHIKKIDAINDTPNTKNNGLERRHKIKSSVTINVENDDFKIEATKIGSSYIEVLGYVKEVPAPRWQLIEKEKTRIVRVNYEMDKCSIDSKTEEYDDLPF